MQREAGHHLRLRHPRSGGSSDHVGYRRCHVTAVRSSRSAPRRIFTTSPKMPLSPALSVTPTLSTASCSRTFWSTSAAMISPAWTSGFKVNEPVQVVVRPEDVQIVPPICRHADRPCARASSSRAFTLKCTSTSEGYEWIIHSTQASQPGELIGMNIGPDEIHIMKRSEV